MNAQHSPFKCQCKCDRNQTHLDTLLDRPIRIRNARTNEYLLESNSLKWFWLAAPRWKIAGKNCRDHPHNLFRIQRRDEGYTLFCVCSKEYVCVVGVGPQWDVLVGRPSRRPTIFGIEKVTSSCNCNSYTYTLSATVTKQASSSSSNYVTGQRQPVMGTRVFLCQSDETNGFVKALNQFETDQNISNQKSCHFIFELAVHPVIRSITPVGEYEALTPELPILEIRRFNYVNNSDLEQTFQATFDAAETYEGTLTHTGGLALESGANFNCQLPLLLKTEFNTKLCCSFGGNSASKVVLSTRIVKDLTVKCKPRSTTIVAMLVTRKNVSISCRIALETANNESEISSYNEYRGIVIEDITIVVNSVPVNQNDLQLLNLENPSNC